MTNWILKKFDDLNPSELYAIMQLRNEVFVVEQNCVYQDADDKDQQSHHFCAWIEGTLAAYCRILPVNLAYNNYSSIGRVISSPTYRRTGIGKELMSNAIEQTFILYPNNNLKIGAQLYLKKFYESFGFMQDGDEYLEDNIPHIPMLLKK